MGCFIALFGNCETSVQGGSCPFTVAAREHQRHSQRGLKMHFFLPRAARVVERENCPLRPAMTFVQERHCEKYRCGGSRETDADFNVTIPPEAPFKRPTDIVQRGKVRGPLRSAR